MIFELFYASDFFCTRNRDTKRHTHIHTHMSSSHSNHLNVWFLLLKREGGKRMARGLVFVNDRNEDGGSFLETANEERVAHLQPRSIEMLDL